MHTVDDVRTLMDHWFPPQLAESWDAPGLVCGDPADEVHRVATALEATDEVVAVAIDSGAQMLLVHHPLLMRGVTTVSADTPKGRLVHRLIRAGVALMAAHTNADAAVGGVNDVLARLLEVRVDGPLHPADHPVDDEWAGPVHMQGIGRVGTLPEPMTLAQFTEHVAERLPRTVWGVRAAGHPEQVVRTVAMCSGAGDSLLAAARRSGADVYLTGDLRHHPADEHLRHGGPALVDVAHWASESPWCADLARRLEQEGYETTVLSIRTDPWTVGVRPPEQG